MNVEASERRAALCVGVSQHRDGKFAALPNAGETTRAVARAFAQTIFGTATAVVDPRSPLDVFAALEKAIRAARGGTFLLYFAGFVTDRGDELLLVVGDADATQRTGCVPWSDVEDLLRRENVARTLVVLNAERSVGEAPLSAIKRASIVVSGAVRPFDPVCGDAELVAYAEAFASTLTAKARTIAGALDGGVLDAAGLDRLLARDATLGHARLRDANVSIVIRDLRGELPKEEPPPPPPPVEEPPPPVEEPPPPVEEPPPPAEEPPPVVEAPPPPEPARELEPVVAAPPAPIEEPRAAIEPARRSPLLAIVIAVLVVLFAVWLARR